MEMFAQVVTNALVLGMTYTLLALGFTLIFSIIDDHALANKLVDTIRVRQ